MPSPAQRSRPPAGSAAVPLSWCPWCWRCPWASAWRWLWISSWSWSHGCSSGRHWRAPSSRSTWHVSGTARVPAVAAWGPRTFRGHRMLQNTGCYGGAGCPAAVAPTAHPLCVPPARVGAVRPPAPAGGDNGGWLLLDRRGAAAAGAGRAVPGLAGAAGCRHHDLGSAGCLLVVRTPPGLGAAYTGKGAASCGGAGQTPQGWHRAVPGQHPSPAHPAQDHGGDQRVPRALQVELRDPPALGKCLLRLELEGFWAASL